jgi:hypothetical protein
MNVARVLKISPERGRALQRKRKATQILVVVAERKKKKFFSTLE